MKPTQRLDLLTSLVAGWMVSDRSSLMAIGPSPHYGRPSTLTHEVETGTGRKRRKGAAKRRAQAKAGRKR